jgi:type I restriction enzyme M protein
MEAVVIILRAAKLAERRRKVLFINAVAEVAREHAQSFLRETHQTKILDAYRSFTNTAGFAAVATLDQIAKRSHSLAIPLYVPVAPPMKETVVDSIDVSLGNWRASAAAADTAIDDVLALVRQKVAQ